MPGTTAGNDHGPYACHCLNVRIRRDDSSDAAPPPSPDDPVFSPLFVGEKGISVAHPQLTVRTRTRGVPIAGTPRFSRYITLTCLLCQLVVYRVYQMYTPEIEGRDGPLLPTEDWVERDILKSLNGWIEVHKDCLVSHDDTNLHVSITCIVVIDTPSTSPDAIFQRPPSRSSTTSPPPLPKFFSSVRPVFLPPPFTPSHPVFTYLASFAAKESEAFRTAAEGHMAEQMKLKTSEIENADVELRRKVNTLWRKFREGVSRIQQETGQLSGRRASASGSRERAAVNGLGPTSSGTPSTSAIRNFIPTSVSRPRSSSPPAPRVSALSVSLATSSFHHPRTRATATSPPPHHRSSSNMSNGTSHSGSTVSSSNNIAIPQSVENVLNVRRNISEALDTATSYRYFVTLEEDMARMRGRTQTKTADASDQSEADGTSHVLVFPNDDDTQKQEEKEKDAKPNDPVSLSRAGDKKGKRKVTFEDKPAVVTIKREVAAEQTEEEEQRPDTNMIFELEDLEGVDQGSPGKTQPTLQLVEQPTAPTRPRKHRPQNVDNLSTSFSGLRPSSLPTPSHILPSRNGSDVPTPATMLSLPKPSLSLAPQTRVQASGASSQSESSDGYNTPPPDPKMLKLLAADTPSHRGAWKPDSKAWQTFVRRQPGHHESGAIIEEGDDDGTDASGFAVPDVLPKNLEREAFVGSLPVSIKLPKQREVLSLASYQPQTLATQTNSTSTSQRKQTSAAIRKAVYAERDRSRTLDPGPLDFASVEDEDEEEDEEDTGDQPGVASTDASLGGERSRKHALRILKKRSQVPDSGMWRSLA
ncbi:hypothetical protein H0H87_009351 [Tephrocybe sp. NHM501043]|nr:hypothetical protein H0H87_009351 [Tephrocybe sp. NHM501043]